MEDRHEAEEETGQCNKLEEVVLVGCRCGICHISFPGTIRDILLHQIPGRAGSPVYPGIY